MPQPAPLRDPKRGKPHLVQGLVELLDILDIRDAHAAEVGSYAGESARIMLNTGRVTHITCIDTWAGKFAEVEPHFDALAAEHPGRVRKVKAASPAAANLFEDGTFDLLYVDADHAYDAVKADLLAWWPKVRDGGVVAGHDYIWKFKGVIKAVWELWWKPDIVTRDGSWALTKRPPRIGG